MQIIYLFHSCDDRGDSKLNKAAVTSAYPWNKKSADGT